MKVMLIIVMTSVLVLGGEALQCYECIEKKINGKVGYNYSESEKRYNVCDNTSNRTCRSEDVCFTHKESYAMTEEMGGYTETVKVEYTRRDCWRDQGKEEEHCNNSKAELETKPGFGDWKCSVKSCDTDLCNTGNIAQVSLFMLAAVVALFGLFF